MFRYYITNTFDGKIQGTNNKDRAYQLSHCEEYFVLDAQLGVWVSYGEEKFIGEIE